MPSTILSLRSTAKVAFAFCYWASGVVADTPATCTNPQISCQVAAPSGNTCCFNSPGGQLLLTQFWDANPPTGPVDSWTLHGLWPDNCDGTYEQFCDSSRESTNITRTLKAAGKTTLLSYMNTYWKDYQGNDELFWQHEWNKHGTCINTLEPSCYTGYTAKEEIVDYFEITVELFKGLDTYNMELGSESCWDRPSTSKTYTSAAIQAALKAVAGYEVTLGCSSGALNEVWYHFNVKGGVPTGEFIAADPDGTKSTCPASGVKYLPKSGGTTTPTPTGTAMPPASTGVFSGKGYLNVKTGSSSVGCIIGAGTWYTTGTCAAFTAAASGTGFTFTSSKGACGIVSGALSCGSSVAATTFTSSNGLLAASGNTARVLCCKCAEWIHSSTCVHFKLEFTLNGFDDLMAEYLDQPCYMWYIWSDGKL